MIVVFFLVISLIKMKFEIGLGSAFVVSVTAEECSSAQICCLFSSSATSKRERKLFSPAGPGKQHLADN